MKKYEHLEVICTNDVNHRDFYIVCDVKDFDNQVAIEVSTFFLEVVNYGKENELDKQIIASLHCKNYDKVFIIGEYECEEFDVVRVIKTKHIIKAGKRIV